jgi:hypothetical protein
MLSPSSWLTWRWGHRVPSKLWYLPTTPHTVTTHRTNINIFPSVKNLKSLNNAVTMSILVTYTWSNFETKVHIDTETKAKHKNHMKKQDPISITKTIIYFWMHCYFVFKFKCWMSAISWMWNLPELDIATNHILKYKVIRSAGFPAKMHIKCLYIIS